MAELPGSLYVPHGEHFEATALTRGPWNPEHQHAGPPAALLAHVIARTSALEDAQTARLSFDILRPVPVGAVRAEGRILRPGRRVEQVEATLFHAGEPVMRATAWRIRRTHVELPEDVSGTSAPPPDPEHAQPCDWPPRGDAGRAGAIRYFDSLEWRIVRGDLDAPGPAHVWTRLRVPLVAGLEATGLERLLVMADSASGASSVLPWDRFLFINPDLGVHLEREPEGEWFAMEATTRIGDAGAGLCTALLSDMRGPLGVCTQSLLIERR